MRSFKDYTSEGDVKSEKTEALNAEELMKKIASAYNGKSNADILRGILVEAEKSKRAGTLTNEELESFYQTFSLMLDATQRKRLRAVIDRLKRIE